jgi:choline-sulfatase
MEPPLLVRYLQRLSEGVPARAREATAADERAELRRARAGYDAEIAYLDFHLGRLLRAVEALPAGENTWVIITGDHGESFGEHYFLSHGAHLYEDNVRVPLLVRRPRGEAERRIREPVQNHTLFGTILKAAGVARPDWARPLPGPDEEKREIVLEVHRSDSNIRGGGEFFDRDLIALLVPPLKLIHSSQGKSELFDLEADPQELNNLLIRRPEMAAELAARLAALQAEKMPLYPEHAPLELRPETEEALRAMGYIE